MIQIKEKDIKIESFIKIRACIRQQEFQYGFNEKI